MDFCCRFVTSCPRALHNMKLVAVACILIASKQEELAPQSVLNLILRTEDTFDEVLHFFISSGSSDWISKVLGMEADVLRDLDYSLTLCTPWRCSEFYRFHILYDKELPASLKRFLNSSSTDCLTGCIVCFLGLSRCRTTCGICQGIRL